MPDLSTATERFKDLFYGSVGSLSSLLTDAAGFAGALLAVPAVVVTALVDQLTEEDPPKESGVG